MLFLSKGVFMRIFRRFGSIVSLLTILSMTSLFALPAQAAIVSNASIVNEAQHNLNKQEVLAQLDRTDIQEKLVAMGVDIDDAKTRVAQMNEQELAQLNENFEQLPAGSGIIGALLVVFVVLVVTDMLGATDVFGFVHNINHR
jgi:hypothetical protein